VGLHGNKSHPGAFEWIEIQTGLIRDQGQVDERQSESRRRWKISLYMVVKIRNRKQFSETKLETVDL
jgi:hypothetical protein